MTRSHLVLVLGLLLAACGGGATTSPPTTQAAFNDADALKKLDAELAKPLPDMWKQSSVAVITDPVAMCNKADADAQAKSEASSQLEKAKNALQDAGVPVQESVDAASVVFSIRILVNCSGSGNALVTGDISAMPGNGAVAAKSDLFEGSRFDAGKVSLALLRNDELVKRMTTK